jgi:Zn-dependent peptidase ImmA (M78 family)
MGCISSLPREDAAQDEFLDQREAWWSRHGLGSALPDFRVPDLHIRRMNTDVELSWDDREWRSIPGGLRLTEASGALLLPATEVARVLHTWGKEVLHALGPDAGEFVTRTLKILENHERSPSLLTRLRWAAGQKLEVAARQLRARAGIAQGELNDTISALLGADDRSSAKGLITPLTMPAMLFKSARPGLCLQDLEALVQLTRDATGSPRALAQFQRRERPASADAAARDGYKKALLLREALGIGLQEPLTNAMDLEALLASRLGVRVLDIQLDDAHIDGVALCSPSMTPTIAINGTSKRSNTPWGRRMTLGHELCHLLHDLDDSDRVCVISNPWASCALERRANAFAAMLLLPEAAMLLHLPRDTSAWTPALLQRAMNALGVGLSTLTWHLCNLKWITDAERQEWLNKVCVSSGE